MSRHNHVYIIYGHQTRSKICHTSPLINRQYQIPQHSVKNVEIPRELANSAARLNIARSAENCGPFPTHEQSFSHQKVCKRLVLRKSTED